MKIANALMGLLLLLSVACTNSKETPNGFKFKVHESGDGVLAKPQEILVFNFLMKDSKDSVWQSTFKEEMPGYLMIAADDSLTKASEDGMIQMFRMLSKGDSVSATIPMKTFFDDMVRAPMPPGVDSTMSISYFIRVTDIMAMDKFREYQGELLKKKTEKQKTIDDEAIKKYLADNNITAQSDSSGLYYVMHTTKGGQKPTAENCVTVNYSGKLLADGKEFDSGEGISFPLQGVISGWRLAIPKLGIGDSATFYIPSGLAYGPQGARGAIPPNSVLIFTVELQKIGQGYDRKTQSCL